LTSAEILDADEMLPYPHLPTFCPVKWKEWHTSRWNDTQYKSKRHDEDNKTRNRLIDISHVDSQIWTWLLDNQ